MSKPKTQLFWEGFRLGEQWNNQPTQHILIFGNNLSVKSPDREPLIDSIEAKVLFSEISSKRVNEAYQHIVALKQSMN